MAIPQKKKKKDKAMSVRSSKRAKERKLLKQLLRSQVQSQKLVDSRSLVFAMVRRRLVSLCKYFRDNGNCNFGDKCIFSHDESADGRADTNPFGVLSDLRDSDERDQTVAAVLRFWDSEADSVGALDLLLSALE